MLVVVGMVIEKWGHFVGTNSIRGEAVMRFQPEHLDQSRLRKYRHRKNTYASDVIICALTFKRVPRFKNEHSRESWYGIALATVVQLKRFTSHNIEFCLS